jgi:hypothetical protein
MRLWLWCASGKFKKRSAARKLVCEMFVFLPTEKENRPPSPEKSAHQDLPDWHLLSAE